LLNVQKTSGDVSFLLFALTGSNQTRLSRLFVVSPILCRTLSKPPLFEVSIVAATTCLLCCAYLPHLCSLIQRSFVVVVAFSVHSPLVSYASVVQTVLRRRSSCPSVVVPSPAFRVFSSSFIIWAFALLVIDAYYVDYLTLIRTVSFHCGAICTYTPSHRHLPCFAHLV